MPSHYESSFWLCPVCQMPIASERERDEPVQSSATGYETGWRRRIRTITHRDGTQHRVPVGTLFRHL